MYTNDGVCVCGCVHSDHVFVHAHVLKYYRACVLFHHQEAFLRGGEGRGKIVVISVTFLY